MVELPNYVGPLMGSPSLSEGENRSLRETTPDRTSVLGKSVSPSLPGRGRETMPVLGRFYQLELWGFDPSEDE